jgi:hypothetical protein
MPGRIEHNSAREQAAIFSRELLRSEFLHLLKLGVVLQIWKQA